MSLKYDPASEPVEEAIVDEQRIPPSELGTNKTVKAIFQIEVLDFF